MAGMRLPALMSVITLLGGFAASAALADTNTDDTRNVSACERVISGVGQGAPSEPTGLGAGIVLDEHLLTNGKRDEDYNGGGEVTLSGERGGAIGRALDHALGFIDQAVCPRERYSAPGWQAGHALAVGLLIFTPKDLASPTPAPSATNSSNRRPASDRTAAAPNSVVPLPSSSR